MDEDRQPKKSNIIALLVIINDFAHDLFTGLWVSTIIVVFLLHRKMPSLARVPEAFQAIDNVMKQFFWLEVMSFSLVVATGIVRLRYYRKNEKKKLEAVKSRALIAKHIILGALFIIGTYFAYYAIYIG